MKGELVLMKQLMVNGVGANTIILTQIASGDMSPS